MPIYEYACEKCGHEFEVEQRITEDPVKTCPACRARKVKRLISRTSFVLKGGGWYSDLYSSDSKPPKKPEGDATESKGSGKTDAKDAGAGDAKPAEKPKAAAKSDAKGSGGDKAGGDKAGGGKAGGKGSKAAA